MLICMYGHFLYFLPERGRSLYVRGVEHCDYRVDSHITVGRPGYVDCLAAWGRGVSVYEVKQRREPLPGNTVVMTKSY